MLKVDLHTHTNHIQPYETSHSPKELIDEAAKRGYDVLCFAEHYIPDFKLPEYYKDPLASYRDFKDYAKEKGILLIPAVEMRYKEGEVVLVNFHEDIRKYLKLEDLKKLPKDVLVFAPHPFFVKSFCIGTHLAENIELFDAIEYCHYYTNFLNKNKKGVAVAKKYGKPMIGTSDCHGLNHFGYTYTLVDAEKNAESIVKAIRAGKVKLMTKPLPLWLFSWITIMSLIKIVCFVPYTKFKDFKKKIKLRFSKAP